MFLYFVFFDKNGNGRNEWRKGVHLHSKSTGQTDVR
jgi:hypothetical protein